MTLYGIGLIAVGSVFLVIELCCCVAACNEEESGNLWVRWFLAMLVSMAMIGGGIYLLVSYSSI